MPHTVKPLLLAAALCAPLCATATAQDTQQPQPPAAVQAAPADEVARGRALLERGDAGAAAALLKTVAERRKTDADAWHHLGVALTHAAKPKDARRAFEKAVKLRPDWAEPRAGLAHALLVLDKQRDAEREASRALALDAKVALAHYVAGEVAARGGRHTRAAQEAEEALRLEPGSRVAATLLGDSLLSVYSAESLRVAERYPMPPDVTEETRKPVFDKREAEMEPLKARMRAAADRLEALARSQPSGVHTKESQELADMLRIYGGGPRGESARIFRQAEITTKAMIIYKPEPGFTEKARQNNVSGVVRLRAVLSADGRVKYILVLKGLPHGLSEKAVAAARQIRFKPATIDGAPVSQWVVLEYNFNVY